jgi:hypothetical protein
MKIKVESIPDSKGQETPSRFLLGTRTINVAAVVDRWYGEQACYYRVLGDDENSYILKGPLEDSSWELVSFTHKDSRGTELEYEGKRELQ